MEDLKDKEFALFMNYFSSLQSWERFGIFSREIRVYNELAKRFGHVYIFTYGDARDLGFSDRLETNITVIPKTLPVPDIVYEFLLPFIRFRTIRRCSILKTNQNSGTIAPAIARLFFRTSRFVMRSGYIGSEFARRNRLPFYARAYFRFAEAYSYRICDRAFIPESDAATLAKKYPFLGDRLIPLNNSISTDLFVKKDAYKRYDIVYLARLETQKNHAMLLDAVAGLGLRVLCIGRGSGRDAIIDQAKRHGIDLTIIDTIRNEDIPDYYNASRICAFPSTFEGNPKALLEAMSCGMPIVAFRVPGVDAIVSDGVSGLLSDVDSAKMRDNILRMIDDAELRERCGANARAFILERFSFRNILAKELDVYRSLLDDTKTR